MLLDSMLEHGEDGGYSEEAVEECGTVLYQLSQHFVAQTHQRETAVSLIRQAVLNLNQLNALNNHSLIETEEREVIVSLIMDLLSSHDIETDESDVTEQWREW